MSADKFLQQTLTDIKVKLEAEFKENFVRKAFFNEKWKTPKFPNSRGSMMLRSGNLRSSILDWLHRTTSLDFTSFQVRVKFVFMHPSEPRQSDPTKHPKHLNSIDVIFTFCELIFDVFYPKILLVSKVN